MTDKRFMIENADFSTQYALYTLMDLTRLEMY